MSVGTALSNSCHRLTFITRSLDSCLLATDRFQLLVFISVDVRLQYFMPCSISVNLNFIQLPQCCSLFWQYKRKWQFSYDLCMGEGNIPCSFEQDSCCTVLKGGKSHKPKSSVGIRDLIHAFRNSIHSVLSASCAVHSFTNTSSLTQTFHFLPVNRNTVLTLYCSNTLQ
jgi:hypothetical protein